MTSTLPPDLGSGGTSQTPMDPNGNLPSKLADLRPLPSTLSTSQSDNEKQTYYWHWQVRAEGLVGFSR